MRLVLISQVSGADATTCCTTGTVLDCWIPCTIACDSHVGDPALKERHGKASSNRAR
jgi:hypothetical protein